MTERPTLTYLGERQAYAALDFVQHLWYRPWRWLNDRPAGRTLILVARVIARAVWTATRFLWRCIKRLFRRR